MSHVYWEYHRANIQLVFLDRRTIPGMPVAPPPLYQAKQLAVGALVDYGYVDVVLADLMVDEEVAAEEREPNVVYLIWQQKIVEGANCRVLDTMRMIQWEPSLSCGCADFWHANYIFDALLSDVVYQGGRYSTTMNQTQKGFIVDGCPDHLLAFNQDSYLI